MDENSKYGNSELRADCHFVEGKKQNTSQLFSYLGNVILQNCWFLLFQWWEITINYYIFDFATIVKKKKTTNSLTNEWKARIKEWKNNKRENICLHLFKDKTIQWFMYLFIHSNLYIHNIYIYTLIYVILFIFCRLIFYILHM